MNAETARSTPSRIEVSDLRGERIDYEFLEACKKRKREENEEKLDPKLSGKE